MDSIEPAIMFLSVLPWFLAARLLGVRWAGFLGALSGFLIGYWKTHSIFTPLEMALMGVLLAVALRQQYRTWEYHLLRLPLGAAAVLCGFYPVLFGVNQTLGNWHAVTYQAFLGGLDYALSNVLGYSVAFLVPALLAGLICQVIALGNPKIWGKVEATSPSPAETSLEVRFFYMLGPLFILLAVALLAGVWIVLGQVSRQMLQDRMVSAANITAQSIPLYLQTGQDLASQLANDSRLYDPAQEEEAEGSEQKLVGILQEKVGLIPYFDHLILLDKDGKVIASSQGQAGDVNLYPEEVSGMRLALNGMPLQSYPIPAREGGKSARIAFLAAVRDEQKRARGVLIGRSEMFSNPYMQPVIASLNALKDIKGTGILLDEERRILYHSTSATLMTEYPGALSAGEPKLDVKSGEDGTRVLVYSQPTTGRAWTVVISVPATYAQRIALQMVLPFAGMMAVGVLFTLRLMQFSLRKITSSLKIFAAQADRIAEGELEFEGFVPGFSIDEPNEIGRLKRSFEKMRQGLKTRLEELNRLLIVSQKVASTLEVERAIRPIIEAALSSGASSARIVLADLSPYSISEREEENLHCYGSGKMTEQYSYLDNQILELTRRQDLILLTNVPRASLLSFMTTSTGALITPQVLIAVALRHENLYHGTFWVAYDQPRSLTQDDADVRFIITLAGQAAVATSNARLFLNSEVGRRRLAAILAATPDPVLVTDDQNRLLLANPAAQQVLGDSAPARFPTSMEFSGQLKPIEKVLDQPELVKLLVSAPEESSPIEINLPDERVYLATVSSISVEGQPLGRVCVMQDVTRFKELDALKSDFVSTVSHDLRSPLTLIHGYVTMLEMVGELNDQQVNYLRRISASIEKMGHLVNNLLDLNRIEAGVSLQLELVALREIVEQVVTAYQLPARQKQIQLSYNLSKIPMEYVIEADAALLQQALNNLLDNAIKFTEPYGQVGVDVETKAGEVIFAISDSGIGIAPVDQVRLFEKFFRAGWRGRLSGERSRESQRQRGTGLGLAIVKSIATRHQGRVWVDSQLGKGSVFYLAVPVRHTDKHDN